MYIPALALALLIGGAVGPALAAEETSQFQTSVPSDALTILRAGCLRQSEQQDWRC
jgi:uncharacterized BrkB/YihY/UPF0761 family membrane protein